MTVSFLLDMRKNIWSLFLDNMESMIFATGHSVWLIHLTSRLNLLEQVAFTGNSNLILPVCFKLHLI